MSPVHPPGYEKVDSNSALRIQDALLHIDVIFNFGFLFRKPIFLCLQNISKRTIVSYLSGEPFKKFIPNNIKEERVNEYYLNINREQSKFMEIKPVLISGDRFL